MPGIRVDVPVRTGERSIQRRYVIRGDPSGGPVASLAENTGAGTVQQLYVSLREEDPPRLSVDLRLVNPATQNATVGINVYMEGATDFDILN